MNSVTGHLRKMAANLSSSIEYFLPVGETSVPLNPLIGQPIRIVHEGLINCIACGRQTKKSYNQGYCYPCMQRLARCDLCIVRPEKCHYAQGTCREPEWAEANCFAPHYVYLANTSGLKVGITRGSQIPTRWIDQGATQALPLFRVADRRLAGDLEVLFKNHVADRTDWRRMLKGDAEPIALGEHRLRLLSACAEEIEALRRDAGSSAIEVLADEASVELSYPVEAYPVKIKALNLDKTPEVGGVLQGIKGQYLILDSGVLNIRKIAGYHISFEY